MGMIGSGQTHPCRGIRWTTIGWRSDRARGGLARSAISRSRIRASGFACSAVHCERDADLAFADLGAADGTLSEVLLEAFPRCARSASTSSDDGATEDVWPASAIAIARPGRLRGDRPADAAGPFDAVVSSRAIHHVADEQKRAVFGWIFDRLRPGGWLLNYVYIRAPTDGLSEIYKRVASDTATVRPDRQPTITGSPQPYQPAVGQLALLESTGFVDVDCFWKHLASAIFGGRRPWNLGTQCAVMNRDVWHNLARFSY